MNQLPKNPSSLRDSEQDNGQPNPFKFKDNLLKLADARHVHEQRSMLDAGRGNPNWTAVSAREAFFALGIFAMTECKLDRDNPSGMGGVPQRLGVAKRFYKYLHQSKGSPGIELLTEIYKHGVRYFSPDVDDMIFEFVEGVVGCQYPQPVRMLHFCERVVRAFLLHELCEGKMPLGENYDLFATEDGTAAICYIFDSLVGNCLLRRGDRVAIGVPAEASYVEVLQLEKYGFEVVYIHASGRDADGNPNYQYPETELDKLGDNSVKAFFAVNPGNPTSVMINGHSRKYLVGIVENLNPDLMIITDNVYATFVDGFSSMMNALPRNTISVYSFSKYFGCTGWRLGVIAMHNDNIYDRMISALPTADKERLDKLYGSLTSEPGRMKFIDRMAADSRDVAMNHTAGLSTPQQVQMAFFAGFAVIDRMKKRFAYKRDCNALLRKRYKLFWEGMEMPVVPDPNRTCYYCMFDIAEWAERTHGPKFFAWMQKNLTTADIVFRLAEECAIVMLAGGGTGGSEWSVRISLANLDSHEYKRLGQMLSATLREYADIWKNG